MQTGTVVQTVSDDPGPNTEDLEEYETREHVRRQGEGLSPPTPSPSLSAGGSCDAYALAKIECGSQAAKRSL